MINLIAEILLALSLGALFIFLIVLGERNKFRVQRGWYIIITAFGLLWLRSLIALGDNFIPALASPGFQNILGNLVGNGIGMLLLLIGLLLWAPNVAASREKYLMRIKTSEQRYRMLAEKATDMLAEHDLAGRFVFVTPGAKRIIGYEPEELEGHLIYDFIEPDQLGMVQLEHRKILTETEPVTVTYKFRHKDGHYVWLESATRVYSPRETGDIERILSISRDVSDRMKYEEDLRNLNKDLTLQQDRIRMLYEFAASYDLSVEEQLEQTLATGMKTLGMELGIVSHIQGEEYKVLHFYPDSAGLEGGQIFHLGDTYCSIALKADDVVAIDEMSTSEHASHPCWEAFHLESYIGVPITVDGKPFGTLNFSKPGVRETAFSPADKGFIKLMGEWVSRVLEREAAQQNLEQSRERYRAIVRSAVVGVILIDKKGFVQSFNTSAEMIFGYDRDEIVGQNIKKLMSEPEHSEHDDYLRRYLDTGKGSIMGSSREVHALHKDGSEIWIDLGLSEVRTETEHYFAGTIQDITARKQAEADLANAHLRLKNVFDSATQVAIIATDLEGNITIFNPGAERMLGYTSDEILGKTTQMFHLKSEEEARAKELSKQLDRKIEGFETYVALAKLGGQVEHEWTYVRKDGSTLMVNSAVTAMHDTAGSMTGFLGVILDITERKRAEEALKLAKAVAEEANLTKSEFLANMSHELRTPLNSVIGFSNILLKNMGGNLGEKDIIYLERIQSNGRHLLDLINDILDLSKIEAGRMELEIVELQIGDLVKDLIAQVESQVQNKPVELLAEIPKDLKPSFTDPGKLKQVLLNLMSNAIKFTSEGSVTIKIVANERSKQVAEIRVIDTGIGIPEERLDKIFDEFSQVDSSTQRKYGGTGLGLSISKSMCTLMGCTLEVESVVGQGSTFIIKPSEEGLKQNGDATPDRDASRTRRKKDRAPEPRAEDLAGKRILIIDDDPDSQTLLNHYLQDTGCSIDIASTAKEGLAKIRKDLPDLITLDLQMPNISGEKFLKALQGIKDAENLPVVVVSIIAREKRGQLAGVADFIQKPVQRQQLLWAIKRNLSDHSRQIMIVEDDPDMRVTLASYLESFHAEILSAADGEDAISLLESNHPDIILLDLKMPGMSGKEFLAKLRDLPAFENTPVIIVTGKSLAPSEELDFKAEGITVVIKNSDLEQELKRQVAELSKV